MPIKNVKVQAKLLEKFKIEGRTANHIIYIDQPQIAGGDDAGPTPLEYLFLSLAGCICSIARIVANENKINLKSLSVSVDGEIDTDFLLGKTKQGRAGFKTIKIDFDMEADIAGVEMTPEQKRDFLHKVDNRCPVSDNLKNLTAVTIMGRTDNA